MSHLSSSAAPKLRATVTDEEPVLEFSAPFLASLEALMLAQAQEGVWQRAVIGVYPERTQRVRLTSCR